MVTFLGIVYASYRLWAVGLSSKYPATAMDFNAYLEFLAKLPFIFSGNYTGYLLLGGILLGGTHLAVRRNFPPAACSVFLLLLSVSLITIYPGSSYLSQEWQSRTTWYRLPFLLNLVFLLGGCFLFKHAAHRLSIIMCTVLLASVLYGADLSKDAWHNLKDRYTVTGIFYKEHKDRIVYSEVPAYWYLGGLKSLYRLHHPFVLSHSPITFDYSKTENVTEIWRYKDGKMFADPELWSYLRNKYM